jgi:hypothetical protein
MLPNPSAITDSVDKCREKMEPAVMVVLTTKEESLIHRVTIDAESPSFVLLVLPIVENFDPTIVDDTEPVAIKRSICLKLKYCAQDIDMFASSVDLTAEIMNGDAVLLHDDDENFP